MWISVSRAGSEREGRMGGMPEQRKRKGGRVKSRGFIGETQCQMRHWGGSLEGFAHHCQMSNMFQMLITHEWVGFFFSLYLSLCLFYTHTQAHIWTNICVTTVDFLTPILPESSGRNSTGCSVQAMQHERSAFPKVSISSSLHEDCKEITEQHSVYTHWEIKKKHKPLQGLHIVLMGDSYYDTYGPRNSRVSMLIVVLIELEVLPDSGALS